MSKFIPRNKVINEALMQIKRRNFIESENKEVLAKAKKQMKAGEPVYELLRGAGFSEKHTMNVVMNLAVQVAKEIKEQEGASDE